MLHFTAQGFIICYVNESVWKKKKKSVILQKELIKESKNNHPSPFLLSPTKKPLRSESNLYSTHKNNFWSIHTSRSLYNIPLAEFRRENNLYFKSLDFFLYGVKFISVMIFTGFFRGVRVEYFNVLQAYKCYKHSQFARQYVSSIPNRNTCFSEFSLAFN